MMVPDSEAQASLHRGGILMSMSLFWLIAMVLFGVLEAVTVGLTSIWFALGAVGALAAAAAAAPVPETSGGTCPI